MYLTGLTLEVQGMSRFSEVPSLVMLEIQSLSPGLTQNLEELVKSGPPEILGTALIGDKLFLSLLPSRVDYESARMNFPVSYAGWLLRQGVDIVKFGLDLRNLKSGEQKSPNG